MNKIKEKMIRWLGGVPKEDSVHSVSWILHWQGDGVRITATNMYEYAKFLYGLPADEWCKKMYKYIAEYYYDHTPRVYTKEEYEKEHPGKRVLKSPKMFKIE